MSGPEDLTQTSLFIFHLLISFGLHSAPPLSRSFKAYFAHSHFPFTSYL